jgi:hypothetical protein
MSQMHGTATYEAGTNGTPRHPRQGRAALPLTPARRVALLIGVPACLALIGFAGLNIVAPLGDGHFHFSHTFPAGARSLSLTNAGGNVVLEQVAAGPARLSGSGYYSIVSPNFTQHATASSAVFGINCNFPVGHCGLNITVSVPTGTAMTVSTGGGDLTADQMAGDLTLHTDGGNIQANDTTGDVTMTTGGGDLTADQATGDHLTLDTDGGNIQAVGVAATRLAARSNGGNIEIVLTVVPRDVTVSTDGGNVTIVVPRGNTQYRVSASTSSGTVTDNTIPTDDASPHEITATSGGGNITIEQSTT